MLKSFQDALNGIILAIRTQRNVKIQLIVAVIITTTGFYLSLSSVEWCIVVLAIGLVMGLEIMNTSIEELVNFVSPERREEARRMKDLAAGAVLLAAMAALVVGITLIISKIWR
jgi:diacylglycerol kinase